MCVAVFYMGQKPADTAFDRDMNFRIDGENMIKTQRFLKQ